MEMKQTGRTIILALLLTVALGCTRNNGDIGPWFGTWRVTGISADGEPVRGYTGNVILKFQSHVMESRAQYDHHSYSSYWCTWHEEEGELLLEINPEEESEGYVPELLIPWTPVNRLRILSLTGSGARLSRLSDEGTLFTYDLKKLY